MLTAFKPGNIKVRMYDIGFGDCFLFYLPDASGGRTRLMLLDFGQHLSGKTNSLTKIGKDIIAQAKAITGKAYIDVVIATHRHYDHISGYDLKAWDNVEVGEVWLPWTEDPTNPQAVELKQMQFEFAKALNERVSSRSAAYGFIQNSLLPLSNDGAMTTLLRGFQGSPRRRFLPVRKKTSDNDSFVIKPSFTSNHLPGVKVHALGPSYDPKIISTLKPPRGEYYEFVSCATAQATSSNATALFDVKYQLTKADHREISSHFYKGRDKALKDYEKLKEQAHFDPDMAAQKLEDVINGTSLVLILEVGHICILLGGDAEWGTWSEILENEKWTSLLSRISLYKVSHHGSYNGTPSRFVEDYLPDDAVSLVSLTPMIKWPSIPRASLISELGKGKRRVFRTDERVKKSGVVTAVAADQLWCEITIAG